METRSNHVLVGTVTLLLLAAIMIAAFWFSRLSQGDNMEYDIFFKQSVNGLAKGSSVNYSGVPSGQVEKIELRSEEHTSELQSLMRTSYAVFRLKKKTAHTKQEEQSLQETTNETHD